MKKNCKLFCLLGLLLVLVLTACTAAPLASTQQSGVDKGDNATGTVQLTTVKVLQLPFLSFAPFFIAQEEGYFAEQGLAVEFIKMEDSNEAVPALIQGDLDVLGGYITVGMLNAMAKGEPIRVVADKAYIGKTDCVADAIMVRNGLVEPGQPIAADVLKTLRFSYTPVSIEAYFVEKLLADGNLTLNDIQFENIPNPAAELEALQQGAVDLALVSEPFVTRITDAKAGVVWKRVSEVTPDFQSAVLIYGSRLLAGDGAVGKRFMTAYLKGVAQYSEGHTARNLAIVSQATGLEEALLQKTCWPPFHIDGYINTTSISQFADWAVTQELLDSTLTEEQFWDARFVEHANQQLQSK
jgi:NitT/TauT family transport system substrate-binding protein